MKIVVVGDIFVSVQNLVNEANKLSYAEKTIVSIEWDVENKKDFQKKALNMEKNGPEAEEIPKGLLEEIEDADVLLVHFAPISRKVIESGKKLKLIGTCRGGLEHIDVEAATEKNIPVIHVIRNAEPVADFTIGMIIGETRNIARSHEAIKKGIWRKEFLNSNITTNLKELKVGIVGLGHIGRLVTKKLNSLEVNVLGYDPFVSEEKLIENGFNIKMIELEELFKKSDVVSLHLRLNEATKNMVGARLLSVMKPSAYLINTSRAGVVEESALKKALQENWIAGAALDVFWQEPIPEDSWILSCDNVTLTSHIAGDTVDAIPKSPKLLVSEINKYLKNGKSELVVNI